MTDNKPVVQENKTEAAPHIGKSSSNTIGLATLFTLAILSAVAPFSIDLYLPAFPAMTEDLHTTATRVQLSLTAFLIGAGVGQVVFGPLSDRTGRLIPLYIGLVLFLVASIVTVFASNVEILVAARLAQGLGGASGMVIGRAMVLDKEKGAAAAKALSIMMVIGGIAPVVAPLAGSLLADLIGWRGLLAIVAGIGVVGIASTVFFIRETLPTSQRSHSAQASTSKPIKALASRGYIGNVVAFAFAMAILMSYISASPFVYQNMIGLDAVGYGFAFAVNAIGITVLTGISARLTGRVTTFALTLIGLSTSFIAIVVISILTFSSAPASWLMVPLFCAIAPLGLVLGNATALALSAVPQTATGTGSAILGLIQFLLAGIVAGLVGIAGEDTMVPLALTMVAAVLIALSGLALGRTERHATVVESTEPVGETSKATAK